MTALQGRKFVTIEPILDFDLDVMLDWITVIDAEAVYIGADSKRHHLPEPTPVKIGQLICGLKARGLVVVQKDDLYRLTPREIGCGRDASSVSPCGARFTLEQGNHTAER